MKLVAILAVCVVVVGCGSSPQDHCSVCRAYPAAQGDHYVAGLIADSLIQDAQRSGLSSFVEIQHDRITRLAADSARCAERCRVAPQMNVTLCGDTIWSTGCVGGGPDSIHFADPKCRPLMLWQKGADGEWRKNPVYGHDHRLCDTTGGVR